MSRFNHSPLCDDFPPPSSPHLQRWSPVHVVAVYHSRCGKTHWAVMDGPPSENRPNIISITHQPLLAGCQHAPHLSQVNEIRRKCRYNRAFCVVQITLCQPCCPPVRCVSQSVCARRTVHMSQGSQVISSSHLPSGSPAARLFICLPFWLLPTHLMLPLGESCRFICPSVTMLFLAAAGHHNLKGGISLHNHILTHTDEVIHVVGVTAAVWPLMACSSDW